MRMMGWQGVRASGESKNEKPKAKNPELIRLAEFLNFRGRVAVMS